MTYTIHNKFTCYPFSNGIGIYTTFYNLESMSCKSILLPLLLERVGVRRLKSITYSPHPNLLPLDAYMDVGIQREKVSMRVSK
jgi:hypothetical protein